MCRRVDWDSVEAQGCSECVRVYMPWGAGTMHQGGGVGIPAIREEGLANVYSPCATSDHRLLSPTVPICWPLILQRGSMKRGSWEDPESPTQPGLCKVPLGPLLMTDHSIIIKFLFLLGIDTTLSGTPKSSLQPQITKLAWLKGKSERIKAVHLQQTHQDIQSIISKATRSCLSCGPKVVEIHSSQSSSNPTNTWIGLLHFFCSSPIMWQCMYERQLIWFTVLFYTLPSCGEVRGLGAPRGQLRQQCLSGEHLTPCPSL